LGSVNDRAVTAEVRTVCVESEGPGQCTDLAGRTELAEAVDLLVLQVNKSPETQADFDLIRDAFVLESSNDYWEVWRRDPTVALPPLQF